MLWRAVGFALIHVAVATAHLAAQGPSAVSGYVADDASSALIPAATLTLVTTGEETQSGPDGSFSFSDAPVGRISVRVSAPGYQGVLWQTEVVPGRALFLEVLLTKLEGSSSLTLLVTDEDSGDAIFGADISLPELGLSVTTNDEGEARLEDIPEGSWLLSVGAFGYGSAQSFIAFDGESLVDGEVALAEGPIYLEGLIITEEMRRRSLDEVGFFDREREGFGYHFDPEEIESTIALLPSDLLRLVPRMQLNSAQGVVDDLFFLLPMPSSSSGALDEDRLYCEPFLYVDGQPWIGGNINDLPLRSIEAVEVFPRVGSYPTQYGGTVGDCGVILIWLK